MKHDIPAIGIRHLDWIALIKSTTLPPLSKLLAHTLSSYMNRGQDKAWPSLSTLCEETSLCKKSVCNHLNALEEEGWITRDRGSFTSTTTYFVSFPDEVKVLLADMNAGAGGVSRTQGGVPRTQGSVSGTTKVVYDVHTNHPMNHPVNHPNNKPPVSPDGDTVPKVAKANGKEFELFWEHWPVKRGKKRAKDAFMRKRFDAEDVPVLIEDIHDRLAHDDQWKRGYIPMASTYINGERWEDEFTGTHKREGK